MRIAPLLVLASVVLAACSTREVNRAIDVVTTAAPSATCHDWGRHVGSADVDIAFCGINGVWQQCVAGGAEPSCKTVFDLRPKPEEPTPAPAPAAVGSAAGSGSGSRVVPGKK